MTKLNPFETNQASWLFEPFDGQYHSPRPMVSQRSRVASCIGLDSDCLSYMNLDAWNVLKDFLR